MVTSLTGTTFAHNILELQRSTHEAMERIESVCVDHMVGALTSSGKRVGGQSSTLVSMYKSKAYLKKIQEMANLLLEYYEDEQGERKQEIDTLRGLSNVPLLKEAGAIQVAGDAVLTEFYHRLKLVKDHHRRHPNELPVVPDLSIPDDDPLILHELDGKFSGEEMKGKYLDMHELHQQFLNLIPNMKKMTYLSFLSQFDQFNESFVYPFKLSSTSKTTFSYPEFYSSYLDQLLGYLKSFMSRSRPLFNFEKFDKETVAQFNELWESGQVRGWKYNGSSNNEKDTSAESSLFCIPCAKQFSNRNVFEGHLKGKKHIKAAEAALLDESKSRAMSSPQGQAKLAKQLLKEKRDSVDKPVALKEHFIRSLMKVMDSVRHDTIAFVDTRQLLTDKEREKFLEDPDYDPTEVVEEQLVEAEENEEDEKEDDKFYNPLKLPLGWDGKPIPYWLYKLHGLGVEYTCEICGNFVYMGRKEFDRHFQEWRHSNGMKALGIPNSKHFYNITQIADAYALFQKMSTTEKDDFKPEIMEDVEDADGNVYNRRTYEGLNFLQSQGLNIDLKRQGIL